MSARKIVVLTTSANEAPAASRTADRLRSARSVWASMPSTSSPVAGSSRAARCRTRGSSVAMAWLYGPRAAGALLDRDGVTGHGCLPGSRLPARIVVARTNGAPWPRRRRAARRRAPGARGPRRSPPRRAKHRGPSGSGRSPTGRPAGPSSRSSARLNGTSAGLDDRRGRRQVVGGGEDAARTSRSATRSPVRSSSARCAEARRRRAADRPRARRRRPRRPRAWRCRRRASRAAVRGGRRRRAHRAASRAGVTRSPRPSTSAGPPARKNGTSEPSSAAIRWRVSASSVHAPGLERGVHGGRRVGRAAGEPRRDGDALVEARGERRQRLPAPDGGRPRAGGRRRSRAGRGCPRRARGRSRRRGACPACRAAGPRARGGPRGRSGPSRCGGRGSRPGASRGPRA